MRIMLTIAGFVVAILLGMIVGYALLGHKSIADILYPETWAHIFQLIFAP
ncbi:DNA-directed RNA polymerase subunit beta [Paenibacillus sp. Z6-24]